ncbi:MAG: MFS transporter, partial [Caulobacteraceae bacterium]|nr:MFS transporter [Caulobacteraceae bacterium]
MSLSSTPASETPQPATGFGAYLFSHGAWYLAFGVQMVLFPYIVRILLQESEVRFGLAQMCLQLPTTVLILIGGFVADRGDPKRIVTLACALTVVTFLALGLMVTTGHLTYGLTIAYALIVGSIGAFAIPARDSLLSLVAPRQDAAGIQQAVSFAGLAQFAAQILGMIFAIAAPFLGVGPLLLALAGLMVCATWAAASLRPRISEHRAVPGERNLLGRMAGDIAGGLKAAADTPVIAAVVICAVAMGVCFMGSFYVLLPLIVESYFTADPDKSHVASALALFSLCFWSGSMISALVLVRIGHIRRKGRVYLTALATGGCVLLACGLTLIYGVLHIINFAHGSMLMLAMFGVFYLLTKFGIDPYLAMVVMVPVMYGFGYALYKGVIGKLSNGKDENILLITLGLSILIENVALMLFKGDSRTISVNYSD